MAHLDAEKWASTLAANPPPSHGANPATWPDNMSDEDLSRGYGFTVLVFAERWADEMERRLVEHPEMTVASVADDASDVADKSLGRWGVAVFQYGCAVFLLAHCWARGEELRQWHNLRTQIHNEGELANARGGVLNPALLTFTDPRAPDG